MLGFLFLIKGVKLVLKLKFNLSFWPNIWKIGKNWKKLKNIEKCRPSPDIEIIEQLFNILTLKHWIQYNVNVEN